MIDILLIEGHPFIRKMLKTKIEIEPDMRIVGEALDGPSSQKLALLLKPGLILLDFDTPDLEGLDLTRELHRILPETPILLLGISDDESLRTLALQAGAADFITKEVNTDLFLAAIRNAVHP